MRLVKTKRAPSEDATRRALLCWPCRESGVQESGGMRRVVAPLDGFKRRFRTPTCKNPGKAQQSALRAIPDLCRCPGTISESTFSRWYCQEQETTGQDGS